MLWRGHSSFATALKQHGKWQLPVISRCSIGAECSARGHFRRWERSSYLIGQLPPALSWAAPSHLGAASPRSVNLTGCVGFRVKTDKQIDNSAPCNKRKKTSALKLGTWNVRTMTPGFSDDLQEIDDVRKTAVIDMELSRLQLDIVAL